MTAMQDAHVPAGAAPLPGAAVPVAIFMYDFVRTGVVVNAVRLANALGARGHRVTLVVCSDEGRMAHRLDAAVRVEVARATIAGRRSPRALALAVAVPALRRSLRRLEPAVLLSAGNHAHLPAMLASRGIPGMRRVLRISNELDHPGEARWMKALRRTIHRHLVRRADRLLLVSSHLAGNPLLAEALASGKAVVTPNGVAAGEVRCLAALALPHPWIGGAEPVVVGVGRLARHKNFATLIRAFARAARERPMKLVIIGGGSPAERQRLLALASRLGVEGRLRLEGELANPFALMARCDAFVLPSLWEGASNALLEALACNLPVVASRCAGNAQEVLGYGRYGLLVDPLDVEGMAQAILYQTGEDPCRPGKRAADYALGSALARACAAILAEDQAQDTPGAGLALEAGT